MSLNVIPPDRQTLKSDSLLLLTALIWGFAFVAQRVGMQYVGPFGFNGVRFALGSCVLLPLLFRNGKRVEKSPDTAHGFFSSRIAGGLLAGLALFAGSSFQQIGMIYTTAGNAGFITGLYVVLVPILGIFMGHKTSSGTWIGALLAAGGLYFLSVTADLTISFGDMLVLLGAFFWACHVHIIGWLSPRNSALKLAFIQNAVCSGLSLVVAMVFEHNTPSDFLSALVPILYGGILSVGVAYTLQVVAQKHARPAHASIILSLEAVFAALGGWLILNEVLTPRAMTGCTLMFCGMLASQLWTLRQKPLAGDRT
jgi:drug/metabolite transporter (DMT)-like permease